MSVAGLRFQRYSGSTTAPQETRSGSYIYSGDPANFHDWEFRTRMRLRSYEDAGKAKARKTSKSGSEVEAPSDSGEEPTSGAEQEASAPAGEAQPANEPPTPSRRRGYSEERTQVPKPVPKRVWCCLKPWQRLRQKAPLTLSNCAPRWCTGFSNNFVTQPLSWQETSVSSL